MNFRLLFTIASLIFTLSLSASYKYGLSICMIFRDEAPYLKEWIEFHRLLGAEHFYLYNNLSEDNYREVLNPYIQSGVVELIEWGQESNNVETWDRIQIGAYNDGLARARKTSKWLALLDSDEFLFPTKENNLINFLKKYEKLKGFGGLLVNWVVFGTSFVAKIPKDQLLIETLTMCAPEGGEHYKSIFLTKRVSHVANPHYVIYKQGYRHFTPNHGLPPCIQIEEIRINHYWSRDEWYLYNVKIPRRKLWGTEAATCKMWAETANREVGTEILRFVPALKQKIPLN